MRATFSAALRLLFAAIALGCGVDDARSQQARLYVEVEGQSGCSFGVGAYNVHTAHVILEGRVPTIGVRAVRFKAPVPCGAFFVSYYGSFLMSGSSQTDITIDLRGCDPGFTSLEILSIVFYAPGPVSGCKWDVLPADGQTKINATDCDGVSMTGGSGCDGSYYVGPYGPNPPDGATDVDINTLLSMKVGGNLMWLADHPFQNYDDGVVCASSFYVGVPMCSNPFDPGTLLPNTTYYWKAANVCGGCTHGEAGYSDVWSFTTGEASLATEQSTWGRIKALYRD